MTSTKSSPQVGSQYEQQAQLLTDELWADTPDGTTIRYTTFAFETAESSDWFQRLIQRAGVDEDAILAELDGSQDKYVVGTVDINADTAEVEHVSLRADIPR